MSTLFKPRLPLREYDQRVEAIRDCPTDDLSALAAAAGLDPTEAFRFANFADCSMDGDDLRRFNLTGCNLRNTTFKSARIQGAIFDLASVSLGALQQATDFDAWFEADIKRKPETRRRIIPSRLPDLAEFREAPFAPEMVAIPAGEFWMGSDETDDEAYSNEKMPDGKKRKMRIPDRFALGKYPVTFEEYDLFCQATRRGRPNDFDWGRGRRPVIDVSWDDANAYAAWLNARLGVEAYGLPSEAQWEYACRAGTNTRRWWGDEWDATRANGDSPFDGGKTSPVGQYAENPFKLSDMIGSVWEWCADAWTENLSDLPPDGRPYGPPPSRSRKIQNKNAERPDRALRGGSWLYDPGYLRSAIRDSGGPDARDGIVGFRLSRTLLNPESLRL